MNNREQTHDILCGPLKASCSCGWEQATTTHEEAHGVAQDHAKAHPMSLIQHEVPPTHVMPNE